MPGPYFPDPAAEALRDPAFSSAGFSADQNGSALELLKYIIANSGTLTYDKLNAVNPTHDQFLGHSQPWALFQPSARTPASGEGSRGFGVAPSLSSIAVPLYDSTLKMFYVQTGAAGVDGAIQYQMPSHLLPYGVGGVMPSFVNSKSYPLPLNSGSRILVVEWYGKMERDVIPGAFGGWGICSNIGTIGNMLHGTGDAIAVMRQSSATNWDLKTIRNGSSSVTTGTSGTADNAIHMHRIEWEDIAGTFTVRHYVDTVLQTTVNSATVPNANVTNMIRNVVPALRTSGMSLVAGIASCYGMMIYWK